MSRGEASGEAVDATQLCGLASAISAGQIHLDASICNAPRPNHTLPAVGAPSTGAVSRFGFLGSTFWDWSAHF